MAGELEVIEQTLQASECNDLLRGELDFGTGKICASIGPFELQQVLRSDGGGFSPMLLVTVTVRKCLIPENVTIASGVEVDVTKRGCVRHCKIYKFTDLQIAWEITVNDLNQNA